MKNTSRFKLFLATAAIALGACIPAGAQEKIKFATGDLKGGSTYATMANEWLGSCSKGDVEVVYTNGGLTNRDLLVTNQVGMAAVQGDTLEFTRRTDPKKVAKIRTLFALHPEEVHPIARADVKKEGGILGYGAKEVEFRSLGDLTGRTVGAVGGSGDTARVISQAGGLNLNVVMYPDNNTMKQALQEGKIDAAFVVGGAPHSMVSSLTAAFRLLPINGDLQKKLVESRLYSPAKLSYSNLGASGIDTVSTQALVVTREYRTPEMQTRLKAMRDCFNAKLPVLQDKTGTHPKWQEVDAAVRGMWPWYDL